MMCIGAEPWSKEGVAFFTIASGGPLRRLKWGVAVAVSGHAIRDAIGVSGKVITVRVAILIEALNKVRLVTFCGWVRLWRNFHRRIVSNRSKACAEETYLQA